MRRFVEMCRRRDLKVNAGKSKVMLLGGEEGLEYEARLGEVNFFLFLLCFSCFNKFIYILLVVVFLLLLFLSLFILSLMLFWGFSLLLLSLMLLSSLC